MTTPEARSNQHSDHVEQQPISREENVRKILTETGAVLIGSHFVFTSGRHSDSYINKRAIYKDKEKTRELCRMWAENFKDKGIDVVVGPARGATTLSRYTAKELRLLTKRNIPGLSAKKTPDNSFVFTENDKKIIEGAQVLIVEDTLTTGGSVKKVVELVREFNGEIIGVGAICNRGGVKPEDIGVDNIDALINVAMNSWPEDECRLCQTHVPIDTRVGKGKEFLLKK